MKVDVEGGLFWCAGVVLGKRLCANNARRTRRERGWGVEPMKNAYRHSPRQSAASDAQELGGLWGDGAGRWGVLECALRLQSACRAVRSAECAGPGRHVELWSVLPGHRASTLAGLAIPGHA